MQHCRQQTWPLHVPDTGSQRKLATTGSLSKAHSLLLANPRKSSLTISNFVDANATRLTTRDRTSPRKQKPKKASRRQRTSTIWSKPGSSSTIPSSENERLSRVVVG